MLVLVPGGVVVTVDVADIVALGDLSVLQVGVRQRGLDHGLHLRPVVAHGARLGEVVRAVVGGAHSLVAHHSLRHLGDSPRATGLNTQVVFTTHHASPALLAPVATPGVTHDPVLLAVLLAPAHHGNGVIQRMRAGGVLVDSASVVVEEVVGGVDGAGDGTTRVDLLHHSLLAGHTAVLLNEVLGVVLDGVAGVVVTAVAANVDVRALVILGFVAHAALVDSSSLVHQLVGGGHTTTVAAAGRRGAVHDHLGRKLGSGPGTLGHQTQTVGHGGGSSHSPAGSAVLGNVLVLGDGHVGHAVDVTTRSEVERATPTDRSSWGAPRSSCTPKAGESSRRRESCCWDRGIPWQRRAPQLRVSGWQSDIRRRASTEFMYKE